MELWIRSQDKKSLTKVLNINLDIPLSSGEVGIKGYFDNRRFEMLGYYKNEERALEVLEAIQKILMFEWDYKDKFSMCRVYIMPKE